MHRFLKQNVNGTKGNSSEVHLNSTHERSEVSFTSVKRIFRGHQSDSKEPIKSNWRAPPTEL